MPECGPITRGEGGFGSNSYVIGVTWEQLSQRDIPPPILLSSGRSPRRSFFGEGGEFSSVNAALLRRFSRVAPVSLGATRLRAIVAESLDHYGVAMADPEGNEFDIN
jgi:hypothetical protein